MGVDELRRRIEDARAEFRRALEAASTAWEVRPGPDAWAPRQIAEHVMAAELGYAGAVASALSLERPAWETFELLSSAQARATHERVAATSSAIMALLGDADLVRQTPSDATVLEVLEKAPFHLVEHAEEIRAITEDSAP